jgi:cytochrome c551/c552
MHKFSILSTFTLLLAVHSFGAPPVEEGKRIFTSRCAACHNVNKTLTGPALAGVEERRSIDWIISFVQSSQTLVKSGDKDAVALFEQFNKIPMPDHKDLSADDIRNIMQYVKSSTAAPAENKAPFRKPGEPLKPNYTPLTLQSYTFFVSFFAVLALLIGALLVLVKVKSIQRQSAVDNNSNNNA